MDDLTSGSTIVHTREPAGDALALGLGILVLVWILNGRQVLLLLVQVILIHFFLELDVLLVNSVDLLSEILMLSLESFNQLILLFDLLYLLVVHVSLDLHLVAKSDELLSLWDNLDESLFLSVAGWLALISFERTLSHHD